MTALSFGGAPGVAVLGGDLTQLRRRGGRWRLRDWRLRTKLTAVLLVPLLLAGVLGALRVADSLRTADDLGTAARRLEFAQEVDLVVHDLQQERHLAAEVVAAGKRADSTAWRNQTQRVDSRIDALRANVPRADELGSAAVDNYRAALDKLDAELPKLRESTLAAGTVVDGTITAYSNLVANLLDLNHAVLAETREPLARQARGVEALTIAKEQLSWEHAVLLAAIPSKDLSDQQQSLLRTAEAKFDIAVEEFRNAVPNEWQSYDAEISGVLTDHDRLLDRALNLTLQAKPLDVPAADWDSVATASTDRIREVERELLDTLQTAATTQGDEARTAAVRDAAVVVVLLLLAVLLLMLVVRSLLRPLRTLRTAAFDVADRRLPAVVRKLRNPDEQIGEMVVDPVPVFSREEVGQVARAFDTVHVQAVRLAAEQAMLRSTINDIFLNLAGRSQLLVERQLKLIDQLEGAEQDPEQLSNLFQLDHLATRMRRNSENLLVLAGGELRRGTERGIAVLDLLRAAVSEIAEYRRVTLRRPPMAMVTGPVAGDLVHLVAELLDNATSAGPPGTPVTLSSALTEDGGLLVEITDCGTGLPPGELHAINERLASPSVVDVSVARQMGLFVVSRLAARHRIRVRLRQQRGEFGIIASVQLPPSLVSVASSGSPDPAAAESTGTEWTETDLNLPVQVSVVEGAAEPDQFSPASVENLGFPRRRSPRTAEQEWLELFGRNSPDQPPPSAPGPDPSASVDRVAPAPPETVPSAALNGVPPVPVDETPASPTGGVPAEALNGVPQAPVDETPAAPVATPPPPPVPLGMPRPTAEKPVESRPKVHEGIFEEVSAWFHEGRPVPVDGPAGDSPADETATAASGFPNPLAAPAPPPVSAPEWHSAADAGWHAANALRVPVDYGVTEAGLPRRRPRAHLVPGTAGAADHPGLGDSSAAPAVRTPDDVRGRLSSYQRGLQHGRHARFGPDEASARAYTPHRGTEEPQQ